MKEFLIILSANFLLFSLLFNKTNNTSSLILDKKIFSSLRSNLALIVSCLFSIFLVGNIYIKLLKITPGWSLDSGIMLALCMLLFFIICNSVRTFFWFTIRKPNDPKTCSLPEPTTHLAITVILCIIASTCLYLSKSYTLAHFCTSLVIGNFFGLASPTTTLKDFINILKPLSAVFWVVLIAYSEMLVLSLITPINPGLSLFAIILSILASLLRWLFINIRNRDFAKNQND